MNDADRIPTNRRPPAATLARLAHEAWDGHSVFIVYGSLRGNLTPSEHRAEIMRSCWENRKPGAFIEQQPPEVREQLRKLRSEDVAHVGAFPDWYAMDERERGLK